MKKALFSSPLLRSFPSFVCVLVFCIGMAQAQPLAAPKNVRITVGKPNGAGKATIDKTMIIRNWAELDTFFVANKVALDAEELTDLHLEGDRTKMTIIHSNSDGVELYAVTVRLLFDDAGEWTPVSTTSTSTSTGAAPKATGNQ